MKMAARVPVWRKCEERQVGKDTKFYVDVEVEGKTFRINCPDVLTVGKVHSALLNNVTTVEFRGGYDGSHTR